MAGAAKVSRRSLIALGAATAAAVPFGGGVRGAMGAQGTLPKLKVAPDQVVREIAGLRPFRPLDPVLDCYMFSRSDGLMLGGSHEEGVWSTDVDPRRAAQILDGHGLIAGGMRG